MKKIQSLVPHICIILAGMFITFTILDYYNPTMAFISGSISKILLFAFCGIALLNAGLLIYHQRKETDSGK